MKLNVKDIWNRPLSSFVQPNTLYTFGSQTVVSGSKVYEVDLFTLDTREIDWTLGAYILCEYEALFGYSAIRARRMSSSALSAFFSETYGINFLPKKVSNEFYLEVYAPDLRYQENMSLGEIMERWKAAKRVFPEIYSQAGDSVGHKLINWCLSQRSKN